MEKKSQITKCEAGSELPCYTVNLISYCGNTGDDGVLIWPTGCTCYRGGGGQLRQLWLILQTVYAVKVEGSFLQISYI